MPPAPESTHENPTDRLRDFVAGWIDMVATQGERAFDAVGVRFPGRPWIPSADVLEREHDVVVRVDLPGIDPDKIEILLTGNMLTVKGECPEVQMLKGETRHRRERPWGQFSRSLPLPVAVDPEKVSAESKNGVLTVTLSKENSAKPRQIQIGVKS